MSVCGQGNEVKDRRIVFCYVIFYVAWHATFATTLFFNVYYYEFSILKSDFNLRCE